MKLPILFLLILNLLAVFGEVRKVNQKTIDYIKKREKWMPKAYDDGYGNPTIGYGHLIKPGDGLHMGSTITKKQGEKLFKDDLAVFERCVQAFKSKEPLNDNEFGALVSWSYNIGCGAATGSTLVKKLQEGKKDEVCDELRRWNKANKKVSEGLKARREEECKLFTSK